MPITVKLKATGPIFTGKAPAITQRAGEGAVRELVSLGQQRLAMLLRPRPGGVFLAASQAGKGKASTGNYRRHLHATSSGMEGRLTDSGVVYGPWLEGVGSRNATTRFKGYASFRRVGQWMNSVAKKVLAAHVSKAVREINGV